MTDQSFDQRADDLIDMADAVEANQAIALLTDALQYVGNSKYMAYKAHFGLGMRYQELNEHQQAVAEFTKAIEVSEPNALILLWRGESFIALGEFDLARKDIEECVVYPQEEALHPDDYQLAIEYLNFLGGKVGQRREKAATSEEITSTFELNPIDRKALIPPSGKLVFSAAVGYDYHWIFSVSADGSNLVQLTDGFDFDNDPAWSPNGSKIAFASTRFGGGWHIGIMDADGNHIQQITHANSLSMHTLPAWSPDGTRIVFQSNRDTQKFKYKDGRDPQHQYQLYIVDIQSGKIARLTHDPFLFDMHPFWSPAGDKIIFASSDQNGRSTIQTITPDGKNRTIIAQDTVNDFSWPAYSPSADQIIFSSSRTDENWNSINDLMIMNLKSGRYEPISDQLTPGLGAKWSPDGKYIVFDSDEYNQRSDIYIMNADGTGIRPLKIPYTSRNASWSLAG